MKRTRKQEKEKLEVITFTYEELLYNEKLHKVIAGIDELWPFLRITERCDCYQKHGFIRHFNSGYYHKKIEVYKADDLCIITYGNTRSPIKKTELRYHVILTGIGKFVLGKIVLKADESYEIIKEQDLEKLLQNYNNKDYEICYLD